MLTQNYDFLARKFKFTILNFLKIEFFDSIWNFLTVWGGYENFEHCDAMTLMQEL